MASRYIPIDQFIEEAHAYQRRRRKARMLAIIKTIATRLLLILAGLAIISLGWWTFPSTAGAAELATPRAAPAASRWSLDISTVSYHLRQWARDSLNQDNPGLGLEYQATPTWGLAGGFYKNSYSRTSAYLLASYTPLHLALPARWSVSAGLAAGLVSGYTSAEAPARPLALAALLQVRNQHGWGFNLLGIPNAGQSAGFIGLQLVAPL
ncbi:conserved hypothetical protein [Thiomonas sp. X19]|uniref:hypothetical protein n=1 Tax=Thiomonas sp. X19 TaxID=1050370 RepID=UPI000B67355A|nr:hypothetical protein [Thiomonas sp. X19]SCC94935.1 conserved hypothetical protein [Thiomonas sp. X19]